MADQWFAEIQHENKIVADWLLWYPDRKKKYEEKRDAVLHASPLPYLALVLTTVPN